MIILAFPTEPFVITVLADENVVAEDKRQLAKETCLQGEFLNMVTSLRIKYAITEIMICGPWDYIVGLVEQVQTHFNDPGLLVMPIPAGDKLEEPFQTTESGLII